MRLGRPLVILICCLTAIVLGGMAAWAGQAEPKPVRQAVMANALSQSLWDFLILFLLR